MPFRSCYSFNESTSTSETHPTQSWRYECPTTIFSGFETVKYEGPDSRSALAYQFYDADRVVMGKPLKEHLRFAVAYWHSLAMTGGDPFGGPTIDRPWMPHSAAAGADPIALAKLKADAAFDLFRVLDLPFFCFHDADMAPSGDSLAETLKNFHTMADYMAKKMQDSKAEASVGDGEPVFRRRALWPALPPTRTPTSSPGPPRR